MSAGHETWIQTETVRRPMNPWLVAVVGWMLLLGAVAAALALR